MWIRIPGKNSAAFLLGVALALLIALPVLAKDKSEGNPEPAPIPAREPEISFNGKVFCSLKRRVDLPFKGVIISLEVKSGQRVEAGQVLAKYRLEPEAILSIRQRLAPPQIQEGEIRLAELERSLVPLKTKQQELTELLKKKLAPPQSLDQVNQDIRLLTQEHAATQARLRQDRQSAQEDRALLKKQLGRGVANGQITQEAELLAPISGYIIWVSPDLRAGAEMDPTPGVFQVGVMDPMLVRAQAFEIEALQIKPGETAEVTLESLRGQKFQGVVNRVSWASMTPGLEQPSYYEVELKVPNPELLLKDGLKAQIVFRKTE